MKSRLGSPWRSEGATFQLSCRCSLRVTIACTRTENRWSKWDWEVKGSKLLVFTFPCRHVAHLTELWLLLSCTKTGCLSGNIFVSPWFFCGDKTPGECSWFLCRFLQLSWRVPSDGPETYFDSPWKLCKVWIGTFSPSWSPHPQSRVWSTWLATSASIVWLLAQ